MGLLSIFVREMIAEVTFLALSKTFNLKEGGKRLGVEIYEPKRDRNDLQEKGYDVLLLGLKEGRGGLYGVFEILRKTNPSKEIRLGSDLDVVVFMVGESMERKVWC